LEGEFLMDFFVDLIKQSNVEPPKENDTYNLYNVFDSKMLEQIKKIERTGVYKILGLRSNKDEVEELLYVGKSKKRDVGVRLHEQLTVKSQTFRKNVKNAGYILCEDKSYYNKIKDSKLAVYVSKVEVLVFPHSEKGEAGRDIAEILLIHSQANPSFFNIEFTDSRPKERLNKEEKEALFKDQEFYGISKLEVEEEKMSTGKLEELFKDDTK
jgi:hypothetical protein